MATDLIMDHRAPVIDRLEMDTVLLDPTTDLIAKLHPDIDRTPDQFMKQLVPKEMVMAQRLLLVTNHLLAVAQDTNLCRVPTVIVHLLLQVIILLRVLAQDRVIGLHQVLMVMDHQDRADAILQVQIINLLHRPLDTNRHL
jgi:hypothetical protein